MCCCCSCSLHHIFVHRINNDNIHQSSEAVFGDKDIHSLLGVAREKVGDLPLNMCSILQNNRLNNMLKFVVGSYTSGLLSFVIY
jgi:hypothetical protein